MTSPAEWEAAGARIAVGAYDMFVMDRPAAGAESGPPIFLLHGFPTCTFDWRHCIDALTANRRLVAPDMLGYGLSPKPDQHYSLFEQADLVVGVASALGLTEVDLVTHDMGNSVGGEVLARSLDGDLPFAIRRRVLTNGSIYIDMAHLTVGQQLLLSLPDERLPESPNDGTAFKGGLAGTFGPETPPTDEELDSQFELMHRERGDLLMPRLVRYIEERRVHERRWTGAIETHAAPLRAVWGELDPVAVWPMVGALTEARPDTDVVKLDAIGHWPMVEAPDATAAAILDWLNR